jgi:hypothetical protein
VLRVITVRRFGLMRGEIERGDRGGMLPRRLPESSADDQLEDLVLGGAGRCGLADVVVSHQPRVASYGVDERTGGVRNVVIVEGGAAGGG